MLSFGTNVFYLAFSYACFVFVVNLLLFLFNLSVPISKKSLTLLFFIAFSIRFVPAILFPFASGYDVTSFLDAGEKILSRENIYQTILIRHRFAFLPTFAFATAGLITLSNVLHVSVIILMKVVIVTIDSFLAVLVAVITKRFKSGLLYATCLIPLLVGAYWGQFDSLPLFFSVLSLYVFSKKRFALSGFVLGLAAAFKPWPLLFLPLFFFRINNRRVRWKFLCAPLVPLVLVTGYYVYFIPDANIPVMLAAIARYESVIGWWGPSIFFQYLADYTQIHTFISVPAFISKIAAIVLVLFVSKQLYKGNLYVATKRIILIVYIVSFGFAIQYLLWILPFALITRDRVTKQYVIFIGIFYLFYGVFNLLNYQFTPPALPIIFYAPTSFLLWSMFLFWGIKEYRIMQKEK